MSPDASHMADPTPETPVLVASRISKRFGITQALDDVSVTFDAGEVHALMGENGAGKSTLGKVISGLYRQDSGTVSLEGVRLPPGSLDAAFAAGVRLVHQELAQCLNLSVAENLCLHDVPTKGGGRVDFGAMARRAARLVHRIDPSIDVQAPLGTLSPGKRQICQIAAALDDGSPGTPGAKVIVFDEPTSSLSIAEADRLMQITRELADMGLTVIYVSHRMSEIFACCDRVTVLRDGRYVATSAVADIDEPALVEQMIGRRISTPGAKGAAARAEAIRAATDAGQHHTVSSSVLLEVRRLRSPGRLRDVDFDVRAGEILGIGGLVGAGRSELLDAIFGIDARATGTVRVAGQPVPRGSPRRMIDAGVGYVPEDRRLQGLFFNLGVDENILAPVMPALASGPLRNLGAERDLVDARIARFQIKTASTASSPAELSGGNQQKLLIARWMSDATKVLLLDEPTRGIDVGTKAEVYKLIEHAAGAGDAVVLVSSEMPELLALADRILVMAEGRIRGELTGADMTQTNILTLATQEDHAAQT